MNMTNRHHVFQIDHFSTEHPTKDELTEFRKTLQQYLDVPSKELGKKLCAMLANSSYDTWRRWETGHKVPILPWILARMRANLLLNPDRDCGEFFAQMSPHLRILQKAAKQTKLTGPDDSPADRPHA